MPKRQGRPIVFVDIAVPRDIEPEVGTIAGVSLYNIDALEALAASNMAERAREAHVAEIIVEEEMVKTLAKFRYLAFRPVLAGLTAKAEHIRQRVLREALAKLPDALPTERKVVEDMSRMLIRKILRDPIVSMTEATGTDQEHFYLKALCALFKLEEVEEEIHRDSKNCRWHPKQQARPVAS
jgi:glutamyl-tRNA reductase